MNELPCSLKLSHICNGAGAHVWSTTNGFLPDMRYDNRKHPYYSIKDRRLILPRVKRAWVKLNSAITKTIVSKVEWLICLIFFTSSLLPGGAWSMRFTQPGRSTWPSLWGLEWTHVPAKLSKRLTAVKEGLSRVIMKLLSLQSILFAVLKAATADMVLCTHDSESRQVSTQIVRAEKVSNWLTSV